MSRLMIGLVLTNVLLIPSEWPSPANPTATSAAAANDMVSENRNRDKTGTNSDTQKPFGSQIVSAKPLTSPVSFVAEGMGLEPTACEHTCRAELQETLPTYTGAYTSIGNDSYLESNNVTMNASIAMTAWAAFTMSNGVMCCTIARSV